MPGEQTPVRILCRICRAAAEETLADKSPESEVGSKADLAYSAGRGGRRLGRPIRPQTFPMDGFDSSVSSSAHMRLCHPSHDEGREGCPPERLIERVKANPASRQINGLLGHLLRDAEKSGSQREKSDLLIQIQRELNLFKEVLLLWSTSQRCSHEEVQAELRTGRCTLSGGFDSRGRYFEVEKWQPDSRQVPGRHGE